MKALVVLLVIGIPTFLYMMVLMMLMTPFMLLAFPKILWDSLKGYGYVRKHWSTLPYLYVHAYLLKYAMFGMKQSNGTDTISL
jgi:hypothetical protein